MCKKLIYLVSVVLVLGLAGNATAQPDPATVTDGHVYLLNDANFVDGTVPDSSAVGLAGNIVGEPYLAEGLFGKALWFDGVDDGVHIPDSQFINVTGGPFPNRTVVTVFKCAHVDKPEKQTVFEEGGLTRGLTVYIHEGLVYVGGWNKAEYQWNPGSWISAPISSNEWYTVALVIRDGTDAEEEDKFEMWMDGELIGKAVGGQIYNHGNDNGIGYTKQNNVFHDGDASGNGWFFEGLVDEVWILNEALTPPELAALAGTTWPYAYGPSPANGAELEEFSAFLEWGPGDGAVSHDVYFGSSLDDVIAGAADTFLGNQPTTSLLAADLVPETTYYWRVDEVNDADPNNPSTAIGEVWSFSLLPRRAYDPDPADGTMAAGTALNLTWTPGWSPIMHQVYFGTDPDQVANAADAPLVMDVGYDTGDLHPGTTYYWRVDEFYGTETVKGPVWTFTTIVYDEETPLDYDNSVDPFISEFSLDLDPAIDVTDPIARIAVNYTGGPAAGSVSVDEAAGTTTVVGRGADIWGTADEFQYAYTTLTGNGSMTVKVDSLAHTHDWSQAGIMIRQTLDAGSSFAMVAVTGADGVHFVTRAMADQDATNDSGARSAEAQAAAALVWIKIERTFPMVTASYSTDGVAFIPLGAPAVIPMSPAPINIGLAVTSRSGAETYAEAVFSEISSDGGVLPGPLTSVEIGGLAANAAELMYLVLDDASGALAAVLNPDAAATQQTSATDFIVDLRKVAIDRSAVTKISLVIGDLDAPAPGGSGSLTIHNIRLLGPKGPVGYWTLDETSGTTAADSSGNGNDGTLNGTAMLWMPADGMIGGALSFDGTASIADYVEISTADISLAAGTIAMWGKLAPEPQAPATRYFCGHTTIPAWSSRIQLYLDNSDTVLDLGLGDSHNRHKDIMSLTTETWYHVALTWDGGNYAVYVNGEEKANGSYIGLDALNTVADIGNDGRADDTGRTEAFNGILDDVRIYDRALSVDEVLGLAGN